MEAYMEWAKYFPKRTSATAAVVAEPESIAVQPKAFDQPFADEYLALANELGVSTTALKHDVNEARLQTTVAELGLRVYNRQQVERYLDAHYGPPRRESGNGLIGTWLWRPLLLSQLEESNFWVTSLRANGMISDAVSRYDKAVPLPVLLTVKNIRAAHPKARFYVSDALRVDEVLAPRDPFLLVTLHSVEMIVERWDEPNYRER